MAGKQFPHVRNALLCLRYGIGDLVMELPAVHELRALLPKARITGLGARPAIELLAGEPVVDELVCVQDFGLRDWADHGSEGSREAFAQWLAARGFDLVIDPTHAVSGAAAVIWQHHRAILDAGESIQNEALAKGADGLAAVKAAVREGWGLALDEATVPVLRLRPEERTFAETFLEEHGCAGQRLLGVSPVASSPLKRWPVACLAAAADSLLVGALDALLVFCGPLEEGSQFISHLRHRRRARLVSDLHLRRVAALLARCRLFVGNDTGLLHLAAAVGVPVAGVYGPTSPAIYRPPGGKAVVPRVWCPHRKAGSFGPPACIAQDRCLTEAGSCIATIAVGDLLAALREGAGRWARPALAVAGSGEGGP
ncbi:MAG: glycosyltransferase family 9 protein [Desulfobacteraceae bacterium]|nr:glycosyltransferase family 9 protein [Desulfobacteraceae bacterium]